MDKYCIMYDDHICDNCGECSRCDLDPEKICDNCMKCVQTDADYNGIQITEVIADKTSDR